jgi:hypothetical protein
LSIRLAGSSAHEFAPARQIRPVLGFALLFEEPCPLRLRRAFLISQPDGLLDIMKKKILLVLEGEGSFRG